MGKFNDLSGQRFGKWTIIHRAADHVSESGKKYMMYRCRCDCGTERFVRAKNLQQGRTQSCGLCVERKRISYKLKPVLNKRDGDSCLYNSEGLVCGDWNCEECGWNPDNHALRSERLRKLEEGEKPQQTKGKAQLQGRAVYCPELDRNFPSVSAAARGTGVSRPSVRDCLNGLTESVKGFHFEERGKQHEQSKSANADI